MQDFKVEKKTIMKSIFDKPRNKELVMQIESLQRFYKEMGTDSENIRTIFALTVGYLEGKVDKLVIQSFFDVLMNQNKLSNDKEIDLLNCFDNLIEEHGPESDASLVALVKKDSPLYKEAA